MAREKVNLSYKNFWRAVSVPALFLFGKENSYYRRGRTLGAIRCPKKRGEHIISRSLKKFAAYISFIRSFIRVSQFLSADEKSGYTGNDVFDLNTSSIQFLKLHGIRLSGDS